jgi:hypothetical protein
MNRAPRGPATTYAVRSDDTGVSDVSLMPVPSEQADATCANCGAALVADQRYCLSCGQPSSPVRLAFLDVLQEHAQPGPTTHQGWPPAGTIELGAGGYAHPYEPGANGWLRRNSGLLGLLGVLMLCLLAGLLVGHWASQDNRTPAKQVVEIKGLGGIPAAAAATGTTNGAASEAAASKASSKQQVGEAKEAAKETKAEKAPPPAPVKVAPAKLKKLSKTTGKKHQEEVNALGAQPIETG